jgi:hypothetical protein
MALNPTFLPKTTRASTQVTYSVNASADDAHGGYNRPWSYTASYVSVGSIFVFEYEEQTGHWRWQINVPAAATIESAYLKLKAYSTGFAMAPMRLQLHDEDDCAAFTSNPYTRPVCSQYVNWPLPRRITAGQVLTSPNIASLVQAFVNRSGYESGNYIGLRARYLEDFFLKWRSYDGGYAAQLQITYSKTSTELELTCPEWQYNNVSFTLTANLTNAAEQPISGKTINFYIDSQWKGNDTTNTNGIATLPIHEVFSTSGNHTVTAEFCEDDNYYGSNDSTIINIRGDGTRHRYIVLVGLNDENPNGLHNSEDDVNDWVIQLNTHKTWFTGTSINHYKKFGDGNPAWDGYATVTNVRNAIQWAVASGDGDDLVHISFSCHGNWNSATGEGYVKLYPYYTNYYETNLASDLNASQQDYPDIMVWFGSCHSGAMDTLHTTPSNRDRIFVISTCTRYGFGYQDGFPDLNNTWFFYYVFNSMMSHDPGEMVDATAVYSGARTDYVQRLISKGLDKYENNMYINRPVCYPIGTQDSENISCTPAYTDFWF